MDIRPVGSILIASLIDEPTLKAISEALAATPDLKVYVVGHTDNEGTYEYNLALSERRAKSVVDALTSDYGVSIERLKPVGVGPYSDKGRGLNRRVELVAF